MKTLRLDAPNGLPITFRRVELDCFRFALTVSSKDKKMLLESNQYLRLTFGRAVKWYEIKDHKNDTIVRVNGLESIGLEDLYDKLREMEEEG